MTELQTQVYRATTDDDGTRLDVYLAAALSVSRGRARTLVETCLVNGAAAKPSHQLRAGDAIEVSVSPARSTEPEPALLAAHAALPPIVFEDDSIVVLNKPCGLTVHPGAGEREATLVDVLRFHGRQLSNVGPPERAGIVHRLDKDTSGLMVVAKTDAAHWKLAADFAERRVVKTYLALVCGVPPSPGRVEAPIGRHPVHRQKMVVSAGGRPSITEYAVVRKWPRFSLLTVNLLTGRTHQIRVHLAYIRCPVAADAIYGGLQRARENAPNAHAVAAIGAMPGQALHAAALEFNHPVSGERMSFTLDMPDTMQQLVAALDEGGTR